MIAQNSSTRTFNLDASVIIATRNDHRTILRAIKSALDQSFVTLEVIVVDDQSQDGIKAQIEKLSDPRVRYFLLPIHMGAAQARNFGISAARGEWIVILDADDAMLPTRLAKMIDLANSVNADCVIDQIVAFDEEGKCIESFMPPLPSGEVDLGFYIKGNILFGSAGLGYLKPIIRRRFLQKHKLQYRPDLRIGEDFALICDMLLVGGRTFLSEDSDYIYTQRRWSVSHRCSSDDIRRMMSYDDHLSAQAPVRGSERLRDVLFDHRDALRKLLIHTLLAENFSSRNFLEFFRLVFSERAAPPFLLKVIKNHTKAFAQIKGFQ